MVEMCVQIAPFIVGVPPLEPTMISIFYTNAERDSITNFSRFQTNNGTIYIGKFAGRGVPSRRD
jgi:hypothetical protein